MSESAREDSGDHVIDLFDVIKFIIKWWKLILGLGALGAVGALMFGNYFASPSPKTASSTFAVDMLIQHAETPTVYVEFKANEKMVDLQPIDYYRTDFVEPMATFLSRLRMAGTYSKEVVSECELATQAELLDRIKVIESWVNEGAVKLSLLHQSPELATRCANALFRMIRSQQAELAKPKIENFSYGRVIVMPSAPTRLLTGLSVNETPAPIQSSSASVSLWGAIGIFVGLFIALLSTTVIWYRRKTASINQITK